MGEWMNTELTSSTEYRLAKDTDCTVLITGPTGSGKSRLAHEIHKRSSRRNSKFVTVQLSSLHEGTLESELFGHERGAFTGAVGRRQGWLSRAEGGTVFLDEIAELTPAAQARLLQFLQTRGFSPLGSTQVAQVNVRIICATNRDLAKEVREGRFREDLYHRMRVVSIELPSVAQAIHSLDEAIHDVLRDLCLEHSKKIHRIESDVAGLFESYSWPGNFREIRNVLEFAMLASIDSVIRVKDLPTWFLKAATQERDAKDLALAFEDAVVESVQMRDSEAIRTIARVLLRGDYEQTMNRFERAYLGYVLQKQQGHLTRAAASIQMPKSTFSRRIQMLGLVQAPQQSVKSKMEALC